MESKFLLFRWEFAHINHCGASPNPCLLSLSAACTAVDHRDSWDLAGTEICAWLWYFSPTLHVQKEGRHLKKTVNEASLQNWPYLNPPFNTGTNRGMNGAPAWHQGKRTHKGPVDGHKKCRKSTVNTMWGGWGLAPMFTRHAIPLPGHSTVQSTVPTL